MGGDWTGVRGGYVCLPLLHCAHELVLGSVSLHFHQAAAQAAGVHPEGPLKMEDLASLGVEAFQRTGASRTAALQTRTGTLYRRDGRMGKMYCVHVNSLCYTPF